MAQYIGLEALVNWLKHIPLKDLSDGQGLCRVIMEDDFKSAISSMPESAVADMVPVVRCKDCVYSRPVAKEKDLVVCTAISKDYVYMMKSDFCRYGALKEATNGGDAD